MGLMRVLGARRRSGAGFQARLRSATRTLDESTQSPMDATMPTISSCELAGARVRLPPPDPPAKGDILWDGDVRTAAASTHHPDFTSMASGLSSAPHEKEACRGH